MGSIIWSELFPTKFSVFIFIAYMTLFVNQGILVTFSQNSDNEYKYSIVTVVLMTEALKLIISTILYCKDHNVGLLKKNVLKDVRIMGLYMIPSFLYCLYNNLSFVNLAAFDPTTYYLLLQTRVVVTGILFQVIFKKYLSRRQWLSLVLLTAGCMIKQVHFSDEPSELDTGASSHIKKNTSGYDFSISALFILVQVLCSCFAGVYNEYLLKGVGIDVNIFIQNIYMYIDSIICNILVLALQGNLITAFTITNLKTLFNINVILIMINNACAGIITSFFLKNLNSILKTFASAIELIAIAAMSYLLFKIPIYLNTIIAICVVSLAIFLYSQSPVVNTKKEVNKEDMVNLLEEGESV